MNLVPEALRRDRVLVGLIALALALRLLYLLRAQSTPLFEVLLIDSEFYDRRARQLLAGDWLGGGVFFMNPFYPYFLAAVYWLCGIRWWVVGLVQAGMGAASCALVFALGRAVWGRREARLAAALAAVYGPFIFYDGALLTATPILFFNLAGLYSLLQWRLHGGWKWLPAAGAALGLSAAARPLVLLFVALLFPWCLRCSAGWKAGLRAWALVCLGILLILGPVALHNYARGGEFVLTTSSAGMNFYVGNHPGATGIYEAAPFLSSAEPDRERDEFLREARRRLGRPLSPAQASRFWLGEGLRFIRARPLAYVALLGRKLYLFWNRVEAQNNLSYYFARDLVPLLRLGVVDWGLVAPPALASWLLLRRRRCPLFSVYAAAYMAGCLLFFVSSEYRLPVAPLLLLYAARGLSWARQEVRKRRWRSLGRWVLAGLLVAVPVNYQDAFAARLTRKRVDYYNFGALYERRGRADKAERMFLHALEIDPDFAPAHRALARLLQQQGRGEEARFHLLRAGEPSPGERRALEGVRLFARQQYEAALAAFEAALAAGQERPELYNNLGLCYYKTGRYPRAEEAYLRALALDRGYRKARYNLALAYAAQGRDAAAGGILEEMVEEAGGDLRARYKLGEVYARQGRVAAALAQWEKVWRRFPDERLRARMDSLRRAASN